MKVMHLNWGFSKQSLKCVILAVFFVVFFFFDATYVVTSGTGTRNEKARKSGLSRCDISSVKDKKNTARITQCKQLVFDGTFQ